MIIFRYPPQSAQNLTRINLIIGCAAAVISSACQSLGLILQRKAHILSTKEKLLSGQAQSPYKRSMWHIGFFLFIFANVFGSAIQIVNLPLIALSPLQSLGLVFNSILSSVMLHEPFTASSTLGTAFVAIGAFIIAFFGGKLSQSTTSLEIFLQLFKERMFIVWSLLSLSIVSVLLILALLISRKSKVANSYVDTYLHAFIELPWVVNNNRKLEGVLYGCSSGILSADSLLLAKTSMDIIMSAFTGHTFSSLNNFIVYFVVAVFISLCLAQLYLLNEGLKYLSTAVLYPLVFCVYNFFSIGNGLVFYQQWKLITYASAILLILGSAMIVYGVFLLSGEKQANLGDEVHIRTSKGTNTHTPRREGSAFTVNSNLTSSTTRPHEPLTYDSTRSLHSYSGDDLIVDPIETSTLCDAGDNEVRTQSQASSSNISTSLPAASMPHSFSNASEFLSPIIKSTTENLNSAGRKVSGFLRKSISNLHGKSTSIGSTTQSDGFSKRIESLLPSRENNERDKFEVPEYISFGSMKDGSSFIKNYDSTNNSQESDNGISNESGKKDRSRSLATKTSTSHKFERNGSKIRSPNAHVLFDTFGPSNIGIPLRKRNLRITTDIPRVSNLGQIGSVSPVQNNELDSDYNSNNTFNYSLNNTIEEIQSQMHEIDNKARICSGMEDQDDLKNYQHASSQVSQNQVELKRKEGRTSVSFVHDQIPRHDSLYVPKRGGKTRNFTTSIIPSVKVHRRNLSFEQSELLEELNGRK